MTSAAPIPEHIQRLMNERAAKAEEASKLEWRARELRVEVRGLSERIDTELSAHADDGMRMLRLLTEKPDAKYYDPEPAKAARVPKAKTERQNPPVAARAGDAERARLIGEATARGDWQEVMRLSTAKL